MSERAGASTWERPSTPAPPRKASAARGWEGGAVLQSVPMQVCMPCPVCSVTGPKVGNPRPQAQPLPPTLAHRKTCQIRDDNLRLFPWQLGVATCAHRVHGAMQGWSTSCKRRLQQGDPQSRQWRGDCQAGRGPPLPHLPPPQARLTLARMLARRLTTLSLVERPGPVLGRQLGDPPPRHPATPAHESGKAAQDGHSRPSLKPSPVCPV